MASSSSLVPVLTATGPPGNQSQVNDHNSRGIKHLVDTDPDLRSIPSEFILPVTLRPLQVYQASIPVVDLDGLDGPDELRSKIIQDIRSACISWGFFRIINHGIKDSLLKEMISAVEGFFSLPWEEKMKYASTDVMNPVRYGTSLNTPAAHVRHWRDYLRHYGHPIHKTFHLWPNNPPNYREVAKEYLEELWRLKLKLAGAVSEGLGLGRSYIEGFLGQGFQPIAANYYPKCPQPHLTLGLAAHSDHGCLTLLMDNDIEGLQVNHDGKWVQVQSIPGTLVINVGDCLEMVSNGRYKSVEHRAVVNEERARISVGMAIGPDLDVIVAPAKKLVEEDGGPRFKPIMYKDYVRNQQSIITRGKNALQAALPTPSLDYVNSKW